MDAHVRDLRYFLAVAEELSFTRAAARCFVSQPALSKQVRALESQLGVQLFVRDRRTVSLTAAGRALLPHAQQVLAAWEAATGALREVASAERGALVVGFSTSLGRGLVPAVRERFARLQPGWQLHFRQVPWSDATAGLSDGTSDVALVWLPVPDLDAYPAEVLVREPRWVALPVGHPRAHEEVVAFADLLDEPFLALPETAGPLRAYWLAEDARQGHPVRVGGVVATADETFEAVANGTGIALLAQGNAALYARPDVVTRPVAGVSPSELAVVWRDDDRRATVRDFVRACQEVTAP